jgi:hypothetical protein
MNNSQRSGNEIPHIGRYGGLIWHVWFLVVGCTKSIPLSANEG